MPKTNDKVIADMRAKGYIPATEVHEKYGFALRTVYLWMDAGTITGVRVGRARFVEEASLGAVLGPLAAPERKPKRRAK